MFYMTVGSVELQNIQLNQIWKIGFTGSSDTKNDLVPVNITMFMICWAHKIDSSQKQDEQ